MKNSSKTFKYLIPSTFKGSFVPETELFLMHVIQEQVALPTGTDTAAVVGASAGAVAVLEAARVPTYAQL